MGLVRSCATASPERVLAVSNPKSQREFILRRQIANRSNLEVVIADECVRPGSA
jgi:hypothetical protein